MVIEDKSGTLFSGILLISGTCMGAGMLAIPLFTGFAGFFPAIGINILCWLFMMATGLLFLEVTLWMPDGSNVLSMSRHFLGPVGQWFGGLFFLFLYYCLMVSYLAGGAPLFLGVFQKGLGLGLGDLEGFILYVFLFFLIVALGAHLVDRVNALLMAGLAISYILLIGVGADDVDPSNLIHKNWTQALFAAPVLFGAYGYHNIIPSVSTYLKRHRRKLRLAIIWGTTIPFIVYTLWQWVVIGSVPLEKLEEGARLGIPASQIYASVTGNIWTANFALFFGFFAIVTSLLGVSLSMVDFLADGWMIENRTGWRRYLLTLLVFVPPALFAFYNPGVFAKAISVAGGIGEAFLNGILPIAMVWVGRYHMKLEGRPLLSGGRGLLILLALFTLVIFGVEGYLLS